MQASIVIGNQDKTSPADARHTLLRFLTDHLYKTAGYEKLIPWYSDRGENKTVYADNGYTWLYHYILWNTCVFKTQLDKFKFDSWQVVHNDGDDEQDSFFAIKLYRGKTPHAMFRYKKNWVIENHVELYKDWTSYFTDEKDLFDKRLNEVLNKS